MEFTFYERIILIKDMFKSLVNREIIKKLDKKHVIDELTKFEKQLDFPVNKLVIKINSLMRDTFKYTSLATWLKYFNIKWISYKYKKLLPTIAS